jgi:flagella basal body P-ring formation protein FlgA
VFLLADQALSLAMVHLFMLQCLQYPQQKRRVLLLKSFLLLSFFCVSVFSAELKADYTISSQELNASVIFPQIKDDFSIYKFSKHRYKKSFSSAVLIQAFKEHNVLLEDKSQGIIHFKRATSLDLTPLKEKIKAYYLSYYPSMKITSVTFKLHSFMQKLPSAYTLDFKPNAYQYKKSTLQLTLPKSKKRHFISYEIHASVKLFKASHNINRGKILKPIDLVYTNEPFERLNGSILRALDESDLRVKKRLNEGRILYEEDLETVPSVLKNKTVYARMVSGNVHLEFQAKSLQDGQVGDIVLIQKSDKQRLKARVIGRNLVQIE